MLSQLQLPTPVFVGMYFLKGTAIRIAIMFIPKDKHIHALQQQYLARENVVISFEEARIIAGRLFELHDILSEIAKQPEVQKLLEQEPPGLSH